MPTRDKRVVRRVLLNVLPKIALSRLTGWLTRIRIPQGMRERFYRWFARRYGASLDEVDLPLESFRSLAEFFSRPLRDGARPVSAGAELVWPCDGRIVTAGPIDGTHIPQIKGHDYEVGELVGDASLADRLRGGSQATIYLAPGDYHRVHSPFGGTLNAVRSLRGTLFPVNPPAVRCIPRLFVRNARRVFEFTLDDGRAAAVVMVGALNVGDIQVSADLGTRLAAGDELGRFGFGSTAIALVAPGGANFADCASETVVRMGSAAPLVHAEPSAND